MSTHRVILALLLASALAPGGVRGEQGDLDALLSGVGKIDAPGVPGPLCVFGDQAFPAVVGGGRGAIREPVVAAGRMGQGRVVAFGHTGYFDAKSLAAGDTGRLMSNAVRWAAGAAGKAEAGPRVAVHRQAGLLSFLQKQGLKAGALDESGWREKLTSCDVLCVSPNSLGGDEDQAAVTKFVEKGGGLVLADLGWGWLQLHPGKNLLSDHPGNRLLAPAGIVWADGYLERTAEGGFAAKDPPPQLTHAGRALDLLESQLKAATRPSKEDMTQAAWTVTRAARSLPKTDQFLLPRLRRLEQDSAAAVPTPEKPLKAESALARVLLTVRLQELKEMPADQVRPHPAAGAFPGPVPADANRVWRTVEIDTKVPGWHSTGLYAPPGEVVEVAVPEAAAGKGLLLRIGAHSDSLWNLQSWPRVPEISATWPLARTVTRSASPFGGLIYIEVPGGSKVPGFPARIGSAVEAPYYVLGKTSPAEWREKARALPAPWAELATGKVILTVPAKAVRKLDDPEDLMKFWDRVLDACAELSGRPVERQRPERYVCDVQISAGYMHSGYPIMTLMDMPEVMVDKARMTSNAHGGVWGLFHELGHNHQSGDWTFDGTGEVTENLFTMYVLDKVCGLPPAKGHGAIAPQARAKRTKAYLAAGADFAQWKKDPFLGLEMYIQLQEAFGWDAYKKVFAEYRDLPAEKRPKNDDEKRDQWMVRFSRTVGKNLGPFFQAWGVPTSQSARASIADLPAWMPEGFPPK